MVREGSEMGAEKQHSSFRKKQNKGRGGLKEEEPDWLMLESYGHQIHVPFLLFLRSWIMDLKVQFLTSLPRA